MHDIRPARATYADVLAAPPNRVAELFDGVLYVSPYLWPRPSHANSSLLWRLGQSFDLGGDKSWRILRMPEIHLGEDVIVPDICGWLRSRMPVIPDTDWFETAPDWACEVLTPSTRLLDQVIKREVYARHGVAHLWHLDPEARVLEVFELTEGKWLVWQTFTGDDEVAAPPFAAMPFTLSDLWAD